MRGRGTAAAIVAALAMTAGTAGAADSSLPQVSGGARPGPDLLYANGPRAPQLENTGPWRAQPILVSGAQAYRGGEFLYQDFLFDDHGGAGSADDPGDPFNQVENMFSPKRGTLSYPTDAETFAHNAADLVELRVKPVKGATALRATLNTLKAADRTAFTVAIGESPDSRAWPHGAGVSSPAQLFLTVHGAAAELIDAATGKAIAPSPAATVDMERRQIDVRIPHAAWNPGTSAVSLRSGVGLWDPDAGAYLSPGPTATATTPGGASASGAALFNMAFRTDEPVPHINYPGTANTIVEGHVGVQQDAAYWRERRQADVLASGDVTSLAARVDFGKLARKVDDDSEVPRSGDINRIFASRFVFGQGADYDAKCFTSTEDECTGRYVGQLQPYALYVPRKPVPDEGFGLVISMHGLSANHNEFLGSNEVRQLGERGAGSIVASPEGRGPDGSYESYAEADVFEMWADVARHYRLDPELTDVTGYSMGGGGTYRLASRWPDLFARAFPIVGPPTSAESFRSLRNVPVLAWYAQTDELVGPEMSEEAFLNAQQAGIRYDHWTFAPAAHITLGNNDEYAPAAAFFGGHLVERDPAHVTYFVDPSTDPEALSPSDHAYWLSAIKLGEGASSGTVDARSLGFGAGDPPAEPMAVSGGTLNGGSHGPLPYHRRTFAWGATPPEPAQNRLDLTTTGLSAITVNAPRARLGCDAELRVTADQPLQVTVGGCDLRTRVRKGTSRVGCVSRRSLVIRLRRRVRGRRVVSTRVRVGARTARTVRGRSTRISLRGFKRGKHVRVRIVSRLAGGGKARSVRRYRICR